MIQVNVSRIMGTDFNLTAIAGTVVNHRHRHVLMDTSWLLQPWAMDAPKSHANFQVLCKPSFSSLFWRYQPVIRYSISLLNLYNSASIYVSTVGHDSSKCLVDNGNGLQPDNDCRDCSKPAKQSCADEYIMTSSILSNGCTKITCKFPGTFFAILLILISMISARYDIINMII